MMVRVPALFKLQEISLSSIGVVLRGLEHEVVAKFQRRTRVGAISGLATCTH